MSYSLARWVLGVVFRVVWRPKVIGIENIPSDGPVIIASNHLSFIDSVVIPLAVPRRVRFLAKAEYFDGPGIRGWVMRAFFQAIDAVPVQRENSRGSMAALETALDVLRAGSAFGIYPEGTRSRDGRLYRGRTGVGWLALESTAPVVPVALIGTDRVQPIGTALPRVHPVRIIFGPVIDPAPYAKRVAVDGGAGRARREITDLVMDRIAALSPQQRTNVYNERPGDDDTSV